MERVLVLVLGLMIIQVQCQPREDLFREQTADDCFGKVADIYLILDSSTSIYELDYNQVLQFARDFVSRLDIDQRFTRVGLISFSDDITRPVLELNEFTSKSDLLASINEQTLPYRTGVTNTDLAIRYARENVNNRDEEITKIIIVVTDGGSRSPWVTAREAETAREEGFYLFVVGVGQYQDEREWRNIASDPDDDFIINLSNFSQLTFVKQTLPSTVCRLPPLVVLRRCTLLNPADVYFVAGPSEIPDAVAVIDRLINSTTSGGSLQRVSYFLPTCSRAENVPWASTGAYCNLPLSQDRVETVTETLARLRIVANQSFRGAKQVVVLFLDEESIRSNWGTLTTEARNIGQIDNIEIIVVDFRTREFYNNFLQGLTTLRDNRISFGPGNVALQRIPLNTLIERVCTVINDDLRIDPSK